MKISTTIDRQVLLDAVTASATAGLPAEGAARMQQLLDELVRDWCREAGTDQDARAVLDLLRREPDASLAGRPAAARGDLRDRARRDEPSPQRLSIIATRRARRPVAPGPTAMMRALAEVPRI